MIDHIYPNTSSVARKLCWSNHTHQSQINVSLQELLNTNYVNSTERGYNLCNLTFVHHSSYF